MANEIKMEPTEEARSTIRRLGAPEWVLKAVAVEMDRQNQFTISFIIEKYASFSRRNKPVPMGLRVVSGHYRRSIHASEAVVDGQRVRSALGSNLVYAAAHEFGATIPARKIVAKGRALRFKIGNRVIYRKSVNWPGATLPAREPIQRGIRDRGAAYGEGISKALIEAWNKG